MLDAVLAADRDGRLNAATLGSSARAVAATRGTQVSRVNHLNFLHLSRRPASQWGRVQTPALLARAAKST